MKVTLNIFGTILVLFGAIWFLQGINLLPGSFMTGRSGGRFTAESLLRPASRCCLPQSAEAEDDE
jgi:hypothetical protein